MNAQEIQAEIARRNALFEGKTRDQKRVLLAQDVLQQIEAGRIASGLGYVYNSDIRWGDYPEDSSLQRLFLEVSQPCRCCAIGALMVSCTLFNNQETVRDWDENFMGLGTTIRRNDPDSIKNGLLEIFSVEELREIERALEDGVTSPFYSEFPLRLDRTKAIMQSIINNNGNITWNES